MKSTRTGHNPQTLIMLGENNMNTIQKLSAFFLALTLLVLCASETQAGNERRVGTAGANELLLPVGSRATALGGSMAAMVSGVEAIHWNPAGVSRATGVEAMFTNMQYIADISLNYFAVSSTFEGIGTFALSLRSLDFGDIPVTTVESPEGTGETFSPNFIVGGLTFSRAFTDRIYGGFTAKIVSESIERSSASGLAFDFGVQYFSDFGIRLGVTLKNLGPSMTFDGEDLETFVQIPGQEPTARPRAVRLKGAGFELPSTLEIGIGYNYVPSEGHNVAIMGSFENSNFGNDEFHGGLEYSYDDMLFLRGGYALQTPSNEDNIYGPTFGAGVKLDVEGTRIGFDYAYRVTDFFDANQWFTLKLGF